MDETFIAKIFEQVQLSEKEISLVSTHLSKVNCKKGDLIIKEGEQVSSKYYIYGGCLRSFFIDEQGKEHTLQFAIKGWWIMIIQHIFKEKKP